MTFTENDVYTLVAILEAAAVGPLTGNQAATARGLAGRFRKRQDEPDDQEAPAPHVDMPEARVRLDVAAIYAKRSAQVAQAMAANPAARLGNGRA